MIKYREAHETDPSNSLAPQPCGTISLDGWDKYNHKISMLCSSKNFLRITSPKQEIDTVNLALD